MKWHCQSLCVYNSDGHYGIDLFSYSVRAVTSCGGGGAKVESTVSGQTLGQELMDLEKAHKEGVISDKEYKKLKENLIKKYGK